MSAHGVIQVRGASQNNLKSLDLDLPLGQFIVITGLSGSGKSSLAFDTLYAEGQRRYAETFSPYTRQFLERMDKPSVREIRGIPPAIAISQVNAVRTTRSTVGTMTEIADYLKLLFPALATLHHPETGRVLRRWTPQEAAEELQRASDPDSTLLIMVEVPFPRATTWAQIRDFLTPQGLTRVWINGQAIRLDESSPPDLKSCLRGKGKDARLIIPAIIDRISLNKASLSRLAESLTTAYELGHGVAWVRDETTGQRRAFTGHLICLESGRTFADPTPALFSFNNPVGACPTCRGFGRIIEIDYHLALPDRSLSIAQGVVKPFQTTSFAECQQDLERACKKHRIPLNKPFRDLTPAQQDFVIHGEPRGPRTLEQQWKEGRWYGVKGFFDWLETRTYKMHVRILLARYRAYIPCPACQGRRFQPETLLWKIHGRSIADLNALPVTDLHDFLQTLEATDESTAQILHQIRSRVRYLVDVGLGYLTLDRPTRTLSGGETQRVNLTTSLGTALTGTLFVLDEPSIGLHPRDTDRLIHILKNLRDQGNTVLVVEHDEAVIRAADHLIELGPGRGAEGGQLVYQGPGPRITTCRASLTGAYLSGKKSIPLPAQRRSLDAAHWLELTGASCHNIRDLDFRLPLRRLSVITGVSGSGKSTLVHEIIYKHLALALGQPVSQPPPLRNLRGIEQIEDVTIVDQTPLTSTPRSTPILYTGAYDAVRELFGMTAEARRAGLTASAFSFNSGQGRCTRCGGTGYEKISMQFLPDVFVLCPACEGKRFQPHVLEIPYRGRSIHQVLEMTVHEALTFFDPQADDLEPKPAHLHQKIHHALSLLARVGLDYLKLGQPINNLSGGESQRLKLVASLIEASPSSDSSTRRPSKSKVIILDEPTTGLHFDDIRVLLDVLQTLVDHGHTLVVIEHQMDVAKCADYILDLGPEAGAGGGRLVACGTPEHVARCVDSHTGKLLRPLLNTVRTKKTTAKTRAIIASRPAPPPRAIQIHGARHHNLKNISLQIPLQKMVVVTGLSGSGKSSLAFDLLFAEGQRRYLDCLNTYARQFIEQMEKPDVDAITGLPPAVAIEQRTTRGGAKSTVATVTELYQFLRLLYAKLGTQHDPDTGEPAVQQTPAEITGHIRQLLRENGDLTLLAPVIKGRKGIYTELAAWAAAKNYPYLRVDGAWVEPARFKPLDRYKEHTIDIILGNLSPRQTDLPRRINEALDLGKGTCLILDNHRRETLFSTTLFCPGSGRSFAELDPRQFSYNSPHGWCPTCQGYGTIARVSVDPRLDTAEREQAIEAARETVDAAELIPCPDCGGSRLNPIARAVRLGNLPIPEINRLTVSAFKTWFQQFLPTLSTRQRQIARDIIPEITQRLEFLEHVGLGYLALDRPAPTLSGGESQRIRLAAQLGSNLQGVLYVLDEPTIGLHPRDNAELISMLRALQKRGNSLLIVEHDEETMRAADHIIDLGPGAGIHGGHIVAQGTWSQVTRTAGSLTGQLLGDPIPHPMRGTRRDISSRLSDSHHNIQITGARAHNLQSLHVTIPHAALTVICGVSGAGKSTLLHRVLRPAVESTLTRSSTRTGKSKSDYPWDSVSGTHAFSAVIEVDQSPIGKTSRSTVATYLGIMDHLRALFAQIPLARMRGFTPAHFSYNSGPGRCPACQGQGFTKVEMNFLPAAEVPCPVCRGRRWTDAVLEVTYKHQNIHNVLQLDVDQAVEFFDSHPSIRTPLELMQQTGLGYLKLGQTSPTLSGGEAQRLKLVAELSGSTLRTQRDQLKSTGRSTRKPTLYLFEEPTVGLHLADVRRLLEMLHRLVDAGHTVVVVEHHLDVIAEADYVIELGPGAGEKGGRLVASGTPEQIADHPSSPTAPFLRPFLKTAALKSAAARRRSE